MVVEVALAIGPKRGNRYSGGNRSSGTRCSEKRYTENHYYEDHELTLGSGKATWRRERWGLSVDGIALALANGDGNGRDQWIMASLNANGDRQ